MTQVSPILELKNGVQLPALGLGVFQSSPDETLVAVEIALADGYRLIGTAAAYGGNEREVGEGIRRSGIDRAEIFVTTKLWISDYGCEPALRGFDASLRRLGLDYVDLYLLHQPMPTEFEATVGRTRPPRRYSRTSGQERSACATTSPSTSRTSSAAPR
jgi:diketogulonate reductase-like aldo/keto reductase